MKREYRGKKALEGGMESFLEALLSPMVLTHTLPESAPVLVTRKVTVEGNPPLCVIIPPLPSPPQSMLLSINTSLELKSSPDLYLAQSIC